MIRVLLIDDHPALRAGVETVLRSAVGIVSVGMAANEDELWPLLRHTRPDVVLMDYHLPSTDGLLLCHRIKHAVVPPAVIIYSAYADAAMTVAAVAAGADGLLDKSAPARDLEEAIRQVNRGESLFPPLTSEAVGDAARRVDEADRPILSMLLDHAPVGEIAAVTGIPVDHAAGRVQRLIQQLAVEVPSGGGGS
jgi:DNA-binding NarL/FixJ family response regulator